MNNDVTARMPNKRTLFMMAAVHVSRLVCLILRHCTEVTDYYHYYYIIIHTHLFHHVTTSDAVVWGDPKEQSSGTIHEVLRSSRTAELRLYLPLKNNWKLFLPPTQHQHIHRVNFHFTIVIIVYRLLL